MGDRSPPDAQVARHHRRGLPRRAAEVCTGKSCQSCTAGVIADCVAVCCCPCAVVNILALTLFKLPWAVARRCLGGGAGGSKTKKKKKQLEAGNSKSTGKCENEIAGETTASENNDAAARGGEGRNDGFGAELRVEEVWLEVGHMGFGRVSFTGVPVHTKGN